MAQLPETFYPDQIQPSRGFDPIPAGLYKLQVIESMLQETSTGSGLMLVLTLEVVDGEYQGRRIWDRLNIRNDSVQAQQIAQEALGDLGRQLKITDLSDSEQLHFKPFMGRVTIEVDKNGQYPPQNRVRYNVNQPTGGQKQTPPQQGGGQRQASRPQQGRPQQTRQPSKPWQDKVKGANQNMDGDEIPF